MAYKSYGKKIKISYISLWMNQYGNETHQIPLIYLFFAMVAK